MKSKLLVLVLICLAAAGLLALVMFWPDPKAPPPSMPSPNGYVDLVNAANGVGAPALLSQNPREWTLEGLRGLAPQTSEALKLARLGLSRECRVTTDFSTNAAAYMARHMPELAAFKQLARAFAAEGQLAEMESRTNDAVRSYLDGMRFSQESVRGGVMIDKLMGLACEGMAANAIQLLVKDLDIKQCGAVIEGLEAIQKRRESADDTLRLEKEYFRRVGGWRDKLIGLVQSQLLKPAKDNLIKKAQDRERQTHLLLLDTAVRAYRLEKGEAPKSLAELVPQYLKAIPLDPKTGAAMDYSLN
jgi:hypothetical protein